MQSTHEQLSSSKKPFHTQRFGSSYKYDDETKRHLDLGGSSYGNQSAYIPSHQKQQIEQFHDFGNTSTSSYYTEGVRERYGANQSMNQEKRINEKSLRGRKLYLLTPRY